VESLYREADDDALVHAMRVGEEAAICEFIERYQHLVLFQARRFRVPSDDRQHWTAELLYDVSLALVRSSRPAPTSLPAYLIAACRRKAMMAERARRARMVRESGAVADAGGERVVVAACSEESLRQAHGPAGEVPSLPAVLERLVTTLDEELDPGERMMLSWMGQRVPYATIAGWLGITRAAVIKRATRLRVRLLGLAFQFGQTQGVSDRRELVRFFRRAGALDAITLARLETGDGEHEGGKPCGAPARSRRHPEAR
jgi:hypothetical protein